MEEKAIYNVNLKVLQNIRMQMNDRYPSLPYTYNRIFTEAQAGGVCRMKFWQMTWENIIILKNGVKKCMAVFLLYLGIRKDIVLFFIVI